jgi:putative ABC transport system permease protein
MRTLRAWLMRFRAMYHRDEYDAELAQELETHLQMHIEENLRAAMTPEEARREALMKLGGMEQTKELYRERRGLPWLETILQDLRFGARMLRKNPGFTAVAVLTLALGIGANTAIFSLVNGILLRPLPFSQPKDLVSVTGTYPKGAFVAMREQMQSLDVATYFEGHEFNLTGRGEPVRLTGTVVSAELFLTLGTRPELGRPFYPGDDKVGRDNYVILSHALWEQQFASDTSIIGKSIELEGISRQVVGVMPANFRFPSAKTQVWIPLHNDSRDTIAYWAGDFMPIIGRLRPGAGIPQARAEVRLFQQRVFQLFPWTMPTSWNADISVVPLQQDMVADVRARLLLLLGAVSLVLLIACVNVANLALSRAATREMEIAVRTAMGADRRRVVRQLLTESVLIAAIGGALGVLLATQGLRLLKSTLPADTPRLGDAHIDMRVLAFTAGLALLTGVLFGLAPALHATRASFRGALTSSRGAVGTVSHRLRTGLAIAEISFAVLLVVAAGLLIRSFWALSHVDPGFRTRQVLTARVTPNQAFCNDPLRCISFYRELLRRMQSVPGVASAACVNTLPLGGRVAKRALDIENQPVAAGENGPLFWMDVVTPEYFSVMNIPVVAGRAFTSGDAASDSAVVIVSAATARHFWGGQSAIGSHVRLSSEQEWRTVVGIVPDVRAYDLEKSIPEWLNGTIYVPYNAKATLEGGRVPSDMSIIVQANLDESQVRDALRRTIAGLNPEVPASEIKSMTAVVSESVATPASTTTLFVVFAGLALVLGVIGIYGVLAFLVSTRTREIGIRLAIGAQPRDVFWMVMKDGARFALVGVSLGLASALLLTRLLAAQLYGVSPADPITFAAATTIMTAVTMLACYVPTRRAARVDPLVALRYE